MKKKLDKMEFTSKPEIHPKGWGYEIWVYNEKGQIVDKHF